MEERIEIKNLQSKIAESNHVVTLGGVFKYQLE